MLGLIVKSVFAFGLGLAAMAGVQMYWMSSIKHQLATTQVEMPKVEMKPIPQFDAKKFHEAMFPKIDPNIGKDAWRGTIDRQISQSINAGRMVPQPPRIYVPRH